MPFLEKAGAFVLNVLSKNEEVQKFTKDFVTASAKWVGSWFLKDDPTAKYILDGKNDVPRDFVMEKLEKLIQNPEFRTGLENLMKESEQAPKREKNIIENADIDADTNIHIGDDKPSDDSNLTGKNIVRGGKFKTKGSFHLGDK